MKVGCTLLPPSLIESELYGHEEGSFTGADQHRRGRFEMADGGTIYLDDVDDISVVQQAKLLRVIEEKVFERVGGTKLIKANVRVVASTKINLLDKVGARYLSARPVLSARCAAAAHSAAACPARRYPGPDGPSVAADCRRCAVHDRRPGHRGAQPPQLARQRARAVPHAGTSVAGRRWSDYRGTAGERPVVRRGRRILATTPLRHASPTRAESPKAGVSRRPWTSRKSSSWSTPCAPAAGTRRPPPAPWA